MGLRPSSSGRDRLVGGNESCSAGRQRLARARPTLRHADGDRPAVSTSTCEVPTGNVQGSHQLTLTSRSRLVSWMPRSTVRDECMDAHPRANIGPSTRDGPPSRDGNHGRLFLCTHTRNCRNRIAGKGTGDGANSDDGMSAYHHDKAGVEHGPPPILPAPSCPYPCSVPTCPRHFSISLPVREVKKKRTLESWVPLVKCVHAPRPTRPQFPRRSLGAHVTFHFVLFRGPGEHWKSSPNPRGWARLPRQFSFPCTFMLQQGCFV